MFDKITKKVVSVLAAVVMAASNVTSVYAEDITTTEVTTTEATTEATTEETAETTTESTTAPADTDLTYQSIELYPDEETEEKVITLDGLMPEGAEATAVDVSENYEGVVAYDITITDGGEEYQPGEENPILVEITDPVIAESGSIELWHNRDDGTREQIFDFIVDEGKLSFYATGFSVYEIVDKTELPDVKPVSTNGKGWQKVSSVADLTNYGEGSSGLYIGTASELGYFFMNDTVTTDPSNSSKERIGIKKTKNNGNASDIATAITLGAVPYYFEQVEGSSNSFYVYSIENNSKKYLTNINPNYTSLKNNLLFTDSDNKVAFTASVADSKFKFNNGDYYWNQQGSASGARFCSYNSANDANNNLYLWYYVPLDKDPYHLDGVTYGLMNHNNGTVGNALMANPDTHYTQLFQLITRENQTSTNTNVLYVLENADITMWTFESAEEDLYYISTTVEGVKKYLTIKKESESSENYIISLEDEANKQKIKVTPKASKKPDESGLIQLSVDGYAISFEGADSNSNFKVDVANSTDTNQYLAFVKKSTIEPAEVITYSADKVSVCDPDDGDSVIVYTRIWNNTQNAYEFYAIDHDGSLYPCYERGDDIMWIGQRVNTLLWRLTVYPDDKDPTKESYYYELYNPYSKKYLAPQFPDQILSDSKIGINMPGRRDGEYYSKILAWDDAEYTYAGLADENHALTIERRDKAGTFYFASMAPISSTLTEVTTVDNNLHGITMKMVDFPNRKTMSNFLGSDAGGVGYTTDSGLLSTNLGVNGYPTTPRASTNRSLGDLYNNNGIGTYTGATVVNHLFIQSTYDATGYFEFDSCQNTATLRTEGGSDGTNFKVYKELATDDSGGNTHDHGQFYPYNYILPGQYSPSHPKNLYTALATPLPTTDPRYGEPLYLLQKTGSDNPNHYNGMELEASFIQTPDGLDDWDHPIIFEFTGDDDFWLYVDDELVIDLGGIHSALAANVNFATGDVTVNGTKTTLRDLYYNNYLSRDGHTAEQAQAYVDGKFVEKTVTVVNANGTTSTKQGFVFNDYSQHTMKIFYMERGAGASNLHMRFNLSSVTPGDVLLTKTLTNTEQLEEGLDTELLQYPYQIWYKYNQGTDESPSYVEKRLTNTTANFDISYKNSSVNIKDHYAASYTIPDTDITIEDVFFISPNRSIVIHFPENTIQYKIVECGVHQDVYDDVLVSDQSITKVKCDPSNDTYYNYETAWQTAEAKPNVVYVNHIRSIPQVGMQKLYIKKVLTDSEGNTVSYDNGDDVTTFTFRLYLTNGTSGELNLADMYDYHVLNSAGEYCTWNRSTQKFESLGKTVYSSLSDGEKYAATFETSMNGAISKIPAGYSVVVPNLPIGSLFKVEERDYEIPLGYTFVSYADEKTNGNDTYQHRSLTSANEGRVVLGSDPKMDVSNQRGWGIEANKTWSDSPFIISHDPVYVAVYADGELVPGTGRKVTDSSPSVRYYFPSLLTGKTFKDYQVYEVELTDTPAFDADGNPTDASIKSRRTKGTLFEVGAVHKANPGVTNDYSYKVEYDGMYVDTEHINIINSATGETDENGNTMRESITNTRTNGVEIFLYDMEDYGKETKPHPLENGVFTLTQDGIEMGSFTSDEDGKITILYSNTGTFQSGAVYVLTQTAAPSTYIKAPFSIAFTVDGTNKTVTYYQSGTEHESPGKWADGAPQNETSEIIAKINIYNKQVELKAVKVDSKNANKTLAGAKFALYRGVNGIDGLGRDNTPIYPNLVSDENGVIPHIDMNLPADIYFLTEVTAPSNYKKLTEDIQFTIHEDGSITLDSSGQGESLPTPDDTTDKYSYQISIPNTSLSSDYYFDIEKIIFVDKNVHNSDMEQKFIFKVERFEEETTDFTTPPAEVFYVMLNCNEPMVYTNDTSITLNGAAYHYSLYHADDTDAYPYSVFSGSGDSVKIQKTYQTNGSTTSYKYPAAIWNGRKTVHVSSEGIYRISEVSGWSKTDYDFWTGSNVYKGYGYTDKTTNHITDGSNGADNYVMFNVSDVKADQFKNVSTTISGDTVYRPTASFTNSETEFAYLSSQSWANNIIKLANNSS